LTCSWKNLPQSLLPILPCKNSPQKKLLLSQKGRSLFRRCGSSGQCRQLCRHYFVSRMKPGFFKNRFQIADG
jgi:hypothetical protein